MKKAIRHYMTPSAHTIGVGRSLADAHRVMREHQIRHLPVLDGGKLVGIATERDLHLIETLKGVDQATVTVEEAMSQDVYAVEPETPLAEVVGTMAEHRYGSAVIAHEGHVLGIFTTIDALRVLAKLANDEPSPRKEHRGGAHRAQGHR